MRITEYSLRELIREVLITENNTHRLDPNIARLVERFKRSIEDDNNELTFVISDKFPTVEITLTKKGFLGFKNIICIARFTSSAVLHHDNDNNKIAHKVSGKGPETIKTFWCSGSYTFEENDLNIGPLLYEIAMEYIYYTYKCAIMPDIRHKEGKKENTDAVSSDAYNVWRKYLERSESGNEITQYQFDLSKKEIEDYRKKDDTKNVEQVTDEDPSDDLNSLTLGLIKKRGQEIEGKKWSKSPLTKAFCKRQGSLITYLLNNPIREKVRITKK